LYGDIVGDWFGRFVSGGADVDGDGKGDLCVGAPDSGREGPGRVFIYRGGPGISAVPYRVIEGPKLGSQFGWQAVTATSEDVDADGRDDFLVGAFQWPNTVAEDRGRAYLSPRAPHVPCITVACAADTIVSFGDEFTRQFRIRNCDARQARLHYTLTN